MSEEDLASAGRIEPAEGTLRVEERTACSIGDPEASVAAALHELGAKPAIDAFLPPVGDTEISHHAVTSAILDIAAALGAIDDASDDAEVGAARCVPPAVPAIRPPFRDNASAPVTGKPGHGLIVGMFACVLLATVGWHFAGVSEACRAFVGGQPDLAGRLAADTVARRIVIAESSGDATARNKLSTASGSGQFLDGTWLDMIRAYRPDLAGRSDTEILDLKRDPDLSREMVARFAEQNAAMLASRCLPVTPATLYLSHFAGGAGAAAVLSAPESADAAATMAEADASGRTTRDMIVTANPFLESFTVADLKHWADRKMGYASGNRLSRM
jgi:hypothetical protein